MIENYFETIPVLKIGVLLRVLNLAECFRVTSAYHSVVTASVSRCKCLYTADLNFPKNRFCFISSIFRWLKLHECLLQVINSLFGNLQTNSANTDNKASTYNFYHFFHLKKKNLDSDITQTQNCGSQEAQCDMLEKSKRSLCQSRVSWMAVCPGHSITSPIRTAGEQAPCYIYYYIHKFLFLYKTDHHQILKSLQFENFL